MNEMDEVISYLDEIIPYLTDLSKPELIRIQVLLTKILSEVEKVLNDSKIDEELFSIVLQELGEKIISSSKFSRTTNGQYFISKQETFHRVLNDLLDGKTYRRNQIFLLKKYLISLLIEDLRARSKPINIRTVCEAMGYFGDIFERQFPSYRKNKLGSLIISRLINGNKEE